MVSKAFFFKKIIPIIVVGTGLTFLLFFIFSHIVSKPSTNMDSNTKDETGRQPSRSTIVFSQGGVDLSDNIKQQVALFQKANPDIEVLIQQLPSFTDYQRTLYEAAFSSGDNSIDVINADIIWTAEFASNGWILPLDRYFDKDMQNDFYSGTIDGCKYNGTLYAIPKRTDTGLLYYRNDIIASPPKTYIEMIEMIKKHRNYPGIKYGYVFQGLLYEGLVCNALEFIWNNGGEIISGDKVTINSPQAIEGLQNLIDIVNMDENSRDVLNFIEEDSRIAFQDGGAIFMRNWPYCYKPLASDSSAVKDKFAIAPLPVGPKGKRSIGTMGGWNYMINKNSKNPDAAWKFVNFMTSTEAQVFDTLTGGTMPTRKSVYTNAELLDSMPVITKLQGMLPSSKLRPASPFYPRISESMQNNFYEALKGKINARTAIENIEKDLNLYMSEQ